MMRIKRWKPKFAFLGAITAALAVLLQGCTGLDVVNAVTPKGGVTRIDGLAYGSHPRQKLDLYKPNNVSGPLPSILFLYGGSWKGGHREDYAFAGRALARAGFLVAVADYRVYPEVAFPAFVDDAAMAVAWLSRNADAYDGITRDIHMIGHSAGAHIVAMVALDKAFLNAEGLTQDILGRWVGLAGPYAFHPSEIDYVSAVFAHLDDEDKARPITFVDAASPSALLLHGEADDTVIPKHSEVLAKAMNDAGVPAEARFYNGIGHAKLVLSLSRPFTGFAPSLEDTARFLKSGQFPEGGAKSGPNRKTASNPQS